MTATAEPGWRVAQPSCANHGQFAVGAPRAGEPQRAPAGAEFGPGRVAPTPGEPPAADTCVRDREG
jgi:hypothetical protein